MSYDNLSSVPQNVLKFHQQLTGEENKISKHSEKHYSSLRSYHTTQGKNPIFRHIKSNNSGTAKVKIVKNERDPPAYR
jgi:hypothetical protein